MLKIVDNFKTHCYLSI